MSGHGGWPGSGCHSGGVLAARIHDDITRSVLPSSSWSSENVQTSCASSDGAGGWLLDSGGCQAANVPATPATMSMNRWSARLVLASPPDGMLAKCGSSCGYSNV